MLSGGGFSGGHWIRRTLKSFLYRCAPLWVTVSTNIPVSSDYHPPFLPYQDALKGFGHPAHATGLPSCRSARMRVQTDISTNSR